MEKIKLSVLQRGYLSGRSMKNRLGGAPCHVYIEAGGKSIDYDRLCSAWDKVIMRHPLLRCKAEDNIYLTEIENSPNNRVILYDLSKENKDSFSGKMKELRENFSGRFMRTEYGHTCALGLVKAPDKNDVLIYDFDLTVGDVFSFQVVLADLAKFYNGESDCEIVDPYIAPDMPKAVNSYINSELPKEFSMPLLGDPNNMHGCNYKSIRFSFKNDTWKKIADKLPFDISANDVWMAISALLIHKISGLDDFFMNIPIFRNDLRSVSDNTELYVARSDKRGCATFGEYVIRLCEELKRWRSGEYPDGFQYEMQIQNQSCAESWTAPVVFSSADGILLLTEEFENAFGSLIYMVSQTPQVWMDIQKFKLPDSDEVYWMVPDGLFSSEVLDEMSNIFKGLTESLLISDCPADENI